MAEEIQRNMMTKEEPIGTDPWVKINKISQKTVEDLHSILSELEEYQTKVLPVANDRRKNLIGFICTLYMLMHRMKKCHKCHILIKSVECQT